MKFIDQRKSKATHLYYAYVYAKDNDETAATYLYRLGSVMEFKREMRDQQRKFDMVKVW